MEPDRLLQKRELFSISLRAQKKRDILLQKRERKLLQMTKAKFLGNISQKDGLPKIVFKDVSALEEMIARLHNIAPREFDYQSELTIKDYVQILTEIRCIVDQGQPSLKEFLRGDSRVQETLMILLTREYVIIDCGHAEDLGQRDPTAWPVEFKDLINLLK